MATMLNPVRKAAPAARPEDRFDIARDFDLLLSGIGLSTADTGGRVTFEGKDPLVPSVARVGAIGALTKAAPAAAAAAIWRMRTGKGQDTRVDLRKTIHAMSPFFWRPMMFLNGRTLEEVDVPFRDINASLYRTRDDRYVVPTGIYPDSFGRMLKLLRCSNDRASIENAIMRWEAFDLENALAEAGLPGCVVRTPNEWNREPQRDYLAAVPLIDIVKIADGDPQPFAAAARPLSDQRVLGLAHVLAGPTCMRTLAEYGADCLNVCGTESFEHEFFYAAAYTGLRSTYLDLKAQEGAATFKRLARDADVFVENLRADKARRLDAGPHALAYGHPRGLVYVSMRCYGHDGPWANRPGFDMHAVCASGFGYLEGTADMPALPKTKVFNDFTSGYLAAAGALAALIRRANEGGSYLVRISLLRCTEYYKSLGLFSKSELSRAGSDTEHRVVDPEVIVRPTPMGRFQRIGSQVAMSETPGFWDDPILMPRGSSPAEWREHAASSALQRTLEG